MSNYSEETNIEATRFVPVTSRYTNSVVLYYTEKKLLTFATYKKEQNLQDDTGRTKYYVVTPGTEFRPDIVSSRVYGTPDFWWRIMESNNIKDIFEFKAGLNLILPNVLLR